MTVTRTSMLALAIAALAAAPAAAPARAGEFADLRHGVEAAAAVDCDQESEGHARTFRFEVPADAIQARLALEGRADVNLYVGREPPRREAGAGEGERGRGARRGTIASSAGTTATEEIVLDRDGEPALESGAYFATVAFERDHAPRLANGKPLERIEFRLRLTLIRARTDGTLDARTGAPAAGSVDPKQGGFRTYAVEVPDGAKVLRIDLYDAPADLNLRARRGTPCIAADDADAAAEAATGTEVLLIEANGEIEGPLVGKWFVDVIDPHGIEFPVPFKLRASLKAEPDPGLLAFPKAPAATTPLERSLLSTVELIDDEGGGSGVLVSDRGWIVTNYHVVQEEVEGKGLIGDRIVVGLTTDPRDPPREAFKARVVASSPELDLALLKCETGLYGQPIPADYRFPTAAIGDAERLVLGDPLSVVGYPAVGGLGSKVSVTFTRGVVSGFERRGATLHIKTDAEINAGNSGGGVYDERFEVVGFATETIGDEGEDARGQIGYIRPVWLVPADWWSKAGVAGPKRGGK